MHKLDIAAQKLMEDFTSPPSIGVVLGSGLGDYAASLPRAITVPYSEVPDMPVSTVAGHAGEFICKSGRPSVLFMRGRFHLYEGYELDDITMPIRVMARMGIKTLIVTNAAGGINTDYKPGDLMLIDDHINLGANPLRGPNMDAFGPRFPDMSRAYDPELLAIAQDAADTIPGLILRRGVYFYMRGPSFETPAEIRALRLLGADAVGMSTVPEVVVARHCGMRVLGISCISNMAAGILDQPLNHAEVIETGERVKDIFSALLDGILEQMYES